MISQSVLFIAAGAIGMGVAVLHGVLMQRLMIAPLLAGNDLPARGRGIFPILMHYSTAVWLLAGAALVWASAALPAEATVVMACTAAVLYSLGAIGNFVGTRGRHFGWIPLTGSVALIVWGVALGSAGA